MIGENLCHNGIYKEKQTNQEQQSSQLYILFF